VKGLANFFAIAIAAVTVCPAMAQQRVDIARQIRTPEQLHAAKMKRIEMSRNMIRNRNQYIQAIDAAQKQKAQQRLDAEINEILGRPIDEPSPILQQAAEQAQQQAVPAEPHFRQGESFDSMGLAPTSSQSGGNGENFTYPWEAKQQTEGLQNMSPEQYAELKNMKLKMKRKHNESPDWAKEKRDIKYFQDDTQYHGTGDPYGFYN
jgi:hypothetical protein